MTRQTAYQILTKYLTNPVLLEHSLATEAVMRALAPHFGQDVEEWGMAGLLHDADYEKAKGHPQKHGILLSQLEPNTIPTNIEHAIQAHNFEETHIQPQSPIDWALICTDATTAYILVLKDLTTDKKLASLTPQFVLQKLQQNDVMKDAEKTHILLCQEKLGIQLVDFIAITLSAIQQTAHS